MVRGLARRRLLSPPAPTHLPVASRTDRGVSARANALLLDSPLAAPALLRALNGLHPAIFFTHARAVEAEFSVRAARRRVYRYLEPAAETDLDRWRAAATVFEGPVDARTFGRGAPPGAPSFRPIDAVRVTPDGPWLVIEVVARSFVWGMVRKVVSAMRKRVRGELGDAELRAAVRGTRRLTLPLAEPEGLLLWDVEYPDPWPIASALGSAHQREYFRGTRLRAARRSAMAELLEPALAP